MLNRIVSFVVGVLLTLSAWPLIHERVHPSDRWYAPKGAKGMIEEQIPYQTGPLQKNTAAYHIFDVDDGEVRFIYSDEDMVIGQNTARRSSAIKWNREARAWDELQQRRSYLCVDRLAGIKMFLDQSVATWGEDSPVLHKIGVIGDDETWRPLRASDFAAMPDTCQSGRERVILSNDKSEPRRAVFNSGGKPLYVELPGKASMSVCAPEGTDFNHWERIDPIAIKWVPEVASALQRIADSLNTDAKAATGSPAARR